MARRSECPACRKALRCCYCSQVIPLRSGPHLVLLVHPREDRSRGAINTARMVARCIPETDLLVGRDFRRHPRLEVLLGAPDLAPWLLYPGPGSLDVADPALERLAGGRRPVLVVPDGSWLGTRQILRFNDEVARLPRVSLAPLRESRYTLRRQPGTGCLCTLEAVHQALEALQPWCPSGPPEALEAMLEVLERVVADQEAFALRSPRA